MGYYLHSVRLSGCLEGRLMNSDLRPAYEHRESDVVGQIKKVRGHLCVY